MKLLHPTSDPYDVMGMYGPGPFRQGVLVDHLHLIPEDRIRNGQNVQWVVTDDGRAWPVLCGEIIGIVTEDGPSDGRCGIPVEPGKGACEGHELQHQEWAQQTEAETIQWERERELMYG